MAKELIIGSAGLSGFEEPIARFLSSRGRKTRVDAWLKRPDTVTTISCLNGATVMEFLRHTVRLEGYVDENAGFAAGEDGKVKAKNFPWWDNSVWLPLEFDRPGGLDDDPTFFIGSCQGLIAELDELKGRSALRLGEVPNAFFDMRKDFRQFVRSNRQLDLSTEDCVRWVWRALRDGAELAITQDVPLWAGPE